MPGRGKTPIQQGWEYARDAKGCQWVIVSNYLELRLYAVGETTHVYEHFALNRLTDPAEYTRFILCLAADQLLTGRTRERLTQSQQIDQDITAQLYRDYKNLRERLLTHLIHDNPGHAPASLLAPAQKLLDRVLFIAFAEDHTLINFGDIQIFEGVTTYPTILIAQNRTPAPDDRLNILTLKDRLPDDLSQHLAQHPATMPHAQLSHHAWQLESSERTALRHKLTHAPDGTPYPTLKDSYGSPYRGVLTGLNEAFVIDRATRDTIIQQDPFSADLIKPYLKGKDLKKWHAQPRDLYIIFTRRGTDIDAYPGIKKHLERYKERLLPKPKDWPSTKPWPGRKAGAYQWFEIQDTVAYYEEFEKPKLIYGHFQPEPLFSMDTTNVFCNNKCYFHPKADWFLVGLLNSACIWTIFSSITTMMRGGFYEATTQNIEKLPIPPATDEQKATIGALAEQCQNLAQDRYALENRIARSLLTLRPHTNTAPLNQKAAQWWQHHDLNSLQTELRKSFKLKANHPLIPVAQLTEWDDLLTQNKHTHQTLSQQLARSEAQLNQHINTLFHLTPADTPHL